MSNQPTKTKTIFRKFKKSGDIIALFPEEPYDMRGEFCMSYQNIGQHGAAAPSLTHCGLTVPATDAESASLEKELRNIGYVIEKRKKISFKMDCARRENAKISG